MGTHEHDSDGDSADLNALLRACIDPPGLVLVVGRPGTGKTTFSLQLAEAAPREGRAPARYQCLAMRGDALAAEYAPSPHLDVRDPYPHEAPLEAIVGVTEADPPSLLVVNYFQLVPTKVRFPSRERDRAHVLRGFRDLADRQPIPIVLLSQLPRSAERPDGPRLDDLPEGFLDTADTLVLLHRDEDTGITTARLVKHPTGNTMTVPLRFDPATGRFAPAKS
jgi:replicative DNA helicase